MDDMVWRNTSKNIVNQSLIISQLTKSNELSLFSCNKMAANLFGIKSSASFNTFISKLQLQLGESVFNSKLFDQLAFKRSLTNLRDYLLARHSKMQRENTKNQLSWHHLSFKLKLKELIHKLHQIGPRTISSSHPRLQSQCEEDQRGSADYVTGIGTFMHLLEEKPNSELNVDYLHCIADIDGVSKQFRVSVFKYQGGPSGAESPLLILCIDEIKKNDFMTLKEQILESRHFVLNVLNFFALQFKSQLALLAQHIHLASQQQQNQIAQEKHTNEYYKSLGVQQQHSEQSPKDSLGTPKYPHYEEAMLPWEKQKHQHFHHMQQNDVKQSQQPQQQSPPRNYHPTATITKLLNICFDSQVIALQSVIQASNFSDCYRYKEGKPLPLSISQFSLSELLLKAFSFFTNNNNHPSKGNNSSPQLFYEAGTQMIISDHRRLLQVVFNILTFLRSKTHNKVTFLISDSLSEEKKLLLSQGESNMHLGYQEEQKNYNSLPIRQENMKSHKFMEMTVGDNEQKRLSVEKTHSDMEMQIMKQNDKGQEQQGNQQKEQQQEEELKENNEYSNICMKTELEESACIFQHATKQQPILTPSKQEYASAQYIKEVNSSSNVSDSMHPRSTSLIGQNHLPKKLFEQYEDNSSNGIKDIAERTVDYPQEQQFSTHLEIAKKRKEYLKRRGKRTKKRDSDLISFEDDDDDDNDDDDNVSQHYDVIVRSENSCQKEEKDHQVPLKATSTHPNHLTTDTLLLSESDNIIFITEDNMIRQDDGVSSESLDKSKNQPTRSLINIQKATNKQALNVQQQPFITKQIQQQQQQQQQRKTIQLPSVTTETSTKGLETNKQISRSIQQLQQSINPMNCCTQSCAILNNNSHNNNNNNNSTNEILGSLDKVTKSLSIIPGDVLKITVRVDGEPIVWPQSSVGSEQIQMLATNEIIKLLGPNKTISMSAEAISFELFINLQSPLVDIDANVVSQAESFEESIDLSDLLDADTASTIAIKDKAITTDIISVKSFQLAGKDPHRYRLHSNNYHKQQMQQSTLQNSIANSTPRQLLFSMHKQPIHSFNYTNNGTNNQGVRQSPKVLKSTNMMSSPKFNNFSPDNNLNTQNIPFHSGTLRRSTLPSGKGQLQFGGQQRESLLFQTPSDIQQHSPRTVVPPTTYRSSWIKENKQISEQKNINGAEPNVRKKQLTQTQGFK